MEQVDDILSHYKINYKRISGVYLKDTYTDVINNKTKTSSLGHLGCILSHVKCCQDAIDNNYNRILVLEDDITFVEDHINVTKIAKITLKSTVRCCSVIILFSRARNSSNNLVLQ